MGRTTQAALMAFGSAFLLFAGSARAAGSADATSHSAKPMCIEDFCLFDSVSKYPAAFKEKDYTGRPAIKPAPVCQPDRANLFQTRPDGSKVTLAFDSRANAPEGEHYWLTGVTIVYKGTFTHAQRKEAAAKLRDRFGFFQFGEAGSTQFKNDHWRGAKVLVNTSLPDLHVELSYSTSTQEKDAQRTQPGCASSLPRM